MLTENVLRPSSPCTISDNVQTGTFKNFLQAIRCTFLNWSIVVYKSPYKNTGLAAVQSNNFKKVCLVILLILFNVFTISTAVLSLSYFKNILKAKPLLIYYMASGVYLTTEDSTIDMITSPP